MPRLILAGLLTLLLSITAHAQEAWDLEKCIAHAMENNIQVRRTALGAEINSINLKQSRLAMLPTLNAGGSHGYNWGQSIDPFTNQFANDRVRNNNVFVSSGVTLYSGFQIQNTIKQSEVDYKASLLDLQELQNIISTSIAQSYLNVLFNEELSRVAASQLSISEQQVERVSKLVEVGQEAVGALYDIESQLAADQLALTNADNALQIAKVDLMTLLQLSFDQTQTFSIVAPDTDQLEVNGTLESLNVIYTSAINQLPQVKAAEARRESSEIGVDVANGSRMPSLRMTGSLGSGYSGNNLLPVGDPIVGSRVVGAVAGTGEEVLAPDITFSDFETKGFGEQLDDNFNQSVSLSLNIPIFNGYSASSNVQRAKVQREIADLDYQGVKNDLFQEVQRSYTNTLAALNSYRSAEQALRSAEQNFTNAEKRYEQAMINTVDFNDAKTRLIVTESQMIRAKYDYLFRKTILGFYQGRPIQL